MKVMLKFAGKILWWICMFFSAKIIVHSEPREFTVYAKVDPRMPSDLENCHLGSTTNNLRLVQCASMCSQHPECHLFCIEGNQCHLYNAHVSRYWKGIASQQTPPKQCFSSWGRSNDAIAQATFAGSPAHHILIGLPEMAANGYTCSTDIGYMYCSINVLRPWWAAILGTVRKITSVRIITRQETRWAPLFENVEIRVGISNFGNGNFSANALLAFYRGPAPHSTTLTFKASRPLKGSVVSFQTVSTYNTYLIIADIQILFS